MVKLLWAFSVTQSGQGPPHEISEKLSPGARPRTTASISIWRWAMGTHFESATTRLEASVIHLFSPSGLLTVVTLILLSVLLFSGSSIERRTMDEPEAGYHQAAVSPILDTAR